MDNSNEERPITKEEEKKKAPTIEELKAIYTKWLPDRIDALPCIDITKASIKAELKYQIAVEGDDVFLGVELDGTKYILLDLKKSSLTSSAAIPIFVSSSKLKDNNRFQIVTLVYFLEDKVCYYSGVLSKVKDVNSYKNKNFTTPYTYDSLDSCCSLKEICASVKPDEAGTLEGKAGVLLADGMVKLELKKNM
jgi:hypothetical protein